MVGSVRQMAIMIDIIPTPQEPTLGVLPMIGIPQSDNLSLHIKSHILEELKQSTIPQPCADT